MTTLSRLALGDGCSQKQFDLRKVGDDEHIAFGRPEDIADPHTFLGLLLTSPAAAIWPSLEFKVAGFSMLDHTHHVVEEGHDDRGPYSLVEAHDAASGIRKRFKDRRPFQAGAWSVAERKTPSAIAKMLVRLRAGSCCHFLTKRAASIAFA